MSKKLQLRPRENKRNIAQLPSRMFLFFATFFSMGLDFLSSPLPHTAAMAAERFEDVEIRVIRPRYFSKRKRLELGIEGVIITNQTFIYTYLSSAELGFHFNEYLALEGSLTFGSSVPKDDKSLLEDEFNIKTQIIRTKSILSLAGLWTPIYGKYQLSSGRLVYFDTFVIGGVGMTGVDYRFSHCIAPTDGSETVKQDYVSQYPTVTIGLGQRFYINKRSSFKWNLRNHTMGINSQDGSCYESSEDTGVSSTHHNLTMQVGYSRFF